MKKIFYILGGLVVLAIIAGVVVLFSLGSLVKAGVNNFGPRITQSRVELQKADISPFSGAGTLKNLTVGNPVGWKTERAFFLREITIELDPKSVRGDHIVVNRILIDQPEITYETTLSNSNLQDLLKNIQAAAGPTEQTTEPAPEQQPGKQIKIEVKSFRLQNGKVAVVGPGAETTVPMPELVLENIGTKEGGLTPDELSAVLVREITSKVAVVAVNAAAQKGLFDKAGEGLRDLLGGRKK